MITEKEVQHIAKLARLGITSEEEKKFTNELSSVLDYIEKLKEVDVTGVEPTSHSILVENIMREDQESLKLKTQNSKLLDLAPDKKDNYLKVKQVL